MTDFPESVRENVEEKPADEFVGGERHEFDSVVVGVITPIERDVTIFEFDDSAVGNGSTVSISAEIFDDVLSIAERRFAVSDPFLFVERADEIGEVSGIAEILCGVEKGEIFTFQVMQKLAAELFGEHPNGHEKLLFRVEPLIGFGQASAGDDAVQMRMKAEILPPSVQNRGDARFGSEILFVGA